MSQTLGSLATGVLVRDPNTTYLGAPIIWKIAQQGRAGYPEGSTTLISDKIIAAKCIDGKEAGNTDGDRRSYGNNRYKFSNVRQWLNSSASAGAWYSAQHEADAPPTDANDYSGKAFGYDDEAGFMAGLSADFINNVLDTTYNVELASVDGGGAESLTDKIFLPSMDEVGLGSGGAFPIFTDNTSRIGHYTAEGVAYYNTEAAKAGFSAITKITALYWWLRNAYASHSYHVRAVNTNGEQDSGYACLGTNGVRPLCNLQSSILVSDAPDSDGVYDLFFIPDTYPQISGGNTDLGDIYGGFNYEYSVTDKSDTDTVTVVEAIDGEQIRSYAVTLGATNTVALTREKWLSLSYGKHTVTITATDTEKQTNTRTVAFTKYQSAPTISGSDQDLGTEAADFDYNYTVYDDNFIDGDTVTVVEKLNGVQIKSYTLTEQATRSVSVSGEVFLRLANTVSSIAITATDTQGKTITRTVTFTKQQDISVTLAATIPNDGDQTAKPVEATVLTDAYIPAGALFSAQICNNGFDASPVWEDCTIEARNGQKYEFTNAEKTADRWGVNIRISITKNTAPETPYIRGVLLKFKY